MVVAEFPVKLSLTPLTVTAVAPAKSVPLMVTLIPIGRIGGVKLVIVAGLIIVKLLALVAVPPSVATVMDPVVAPAGTVARTVVAESTVKVALTPLNVTAVAPAKFVPVIVT